MSHSALLLNSVMSAFRAEFIATRAMDFIGMIKECDESGFPKVGSGTSLGEGMRGSLYVVALGRGFRGKKGWDSEGWLCL